MTPTRTGKTHEYELQISNAPVDLNFKDMDNIGNLHVKDTRKKQNTLSKPTKIKIKTN